MTIFFISYFLFVNTLALYLMYSDKQKAIKNEWRIPESHLFFLCAIGGFIGTFLGMKYFRHKTQHWQFHACVIVSACFWLLLLPFSLYTWLI